jgi:hypothetical protein
MDDPITKFVGLLAAVGIAALVALTIGYIALMILVSPVSTFGRQP